jgi:hypothetical protein
MRCTPHEPTGCAPKLKSTGQFVLESQKRFAPPFVLENRKSMGFVMLEIANGRLGRFILKDNMGEWPQHTWGRGANEPLNFQSLKKKPLSKA